MFGLKTTTILLSAFIMNTFMIGAVHADDVSVANNYVPNKSNMETVSMGEGSGIYPLIRLTPDKLEMIELEQDAVSVFVGNPAHLNVLLDTPQKLVLIPRQPGATHFKVTNLEGDTIMERHVIVASPKQDFVRIRRSCAMMGDEAENCQEYSIFFCPDMCHTVALPPKESDGKDKDIPDQASGSPNNSNNETAQN